MSPDPCAGLGTPDLNHVEERQMDSLTISHALDFRNVRADKTSRINLLLSFTGRHLADNEPRPPLNLITVLDFSSSMIGEPVRALKETMACIIDHLTPNDRLSVIVFDMLPNIICGALSMNDTSRQHVKTIVQALQNGRGTNIYEGVEAGLAFAKHPDIAENAINRMLLLTDGHPSVGHVSPASILGLLRQRPSGLTVSTFGYGQHHHDIMLQEIASQAGGNYHYIHADHATARDGHVRAVAHAFGMEVGGLFSCVAKDLRCEISANRDFLIAELNRTHGNGPVLITLPDIYADETRYAVLKIEAGPVTSAVMRRPVRVAEASVEYYDLIARRRVRDAFKITVNFVKAGLEQKEADVNVEERVLMINAARVQREALEMANCGMLREARDMIAGVKEQLPDLIRRGSRCAEELGAMLDEMLRIMQDLNTYSERRQEAGSLMWGATSGRSASHLQRIGSRNEQQKSLTSMLMESEGHFTRNENLNVWQCRCGKWCLPHEKFCSECGHRH